MVSLLARQRPPPNEEETTTHTDMPVGRDTEEETAAMAVACMLVVYPIPVATANRALSQQSSTYLLTVNSYAIEC